MMYEHPPYRPPSEAGSILFRVTRGCPWNQCTFCSMYKETRFERRPVEDVIHELGRKLENIRPDAITFSGSGEPTLHSGIDRLITFIRRETNTRIAILTNGSMLADPDVRHSLLEADLVVPSLDAGCQETFEYVNRPHDQINFNQMLVGLVKFRQEYQGQYWLEVFICRGVTDSDDEIDRIADCIKQIDPDKVQLNTVTRPPTESFAQPVPPDQMEQIAQRLRQQWGWPVEVIADYQKTHDQPEFKAKKQDVLNLLARRPCSTADIATGLAIHPNEVIKYLEELTTEGKIEKELVNDKVYYKIMED